VLLQMISNNFFLWKDKDKIRGVSFDKSQITKLQTCFHK
jgi:hypothetical protein